MFGTKVCLFIALSCTPIVYSVDNVQQTKSSPEIRKRRQVADLIASLDKDQCRSKSAELVDFLIEEAKSVKRWAAISVEMNNFSKWNLTNTRAEVIEGKVNQTSYTTRPGCATAIYASQLYFAGRTEGYQIWIIQQTGKACLLYWRVDSGQKTKMSPNIIGLKCKENVLRMNTLKSHVSKDGVRGVKSNLVYGYTKTKGARVQDCMTDFCVTATMSMGNKPLVNIDLIPRSISNWADQYPGMTETEIDEILLETVTEVETEGCSFDNWDMIGIWIGVAIGGLVSLIIFIFGMKCVKDCCCKNSKDDRSNGSDSNDNNSNKKKKKKNNSKNNK